VAYLVFVIGEAVGGEHAPPLLVLGESAVGLLLEEALQDYLLPVFALGQRRLVSATAASAGDDPDLPRLGVIARGRRCRLLLVISLALCSEATDEERRKKKNED
jgi:hypothetical protein